MRGIAISMYLSVYTSVYPVTCLKNHISIANFAKFSVPVRVNCGRGLVLFGRRCNTLCISGFVSGIVTTPVSGCYFLGRSM